MPHSEGGCRPTLAGQHDRRLQSQNIIGGEPFEPAVREKTDPVPEVRVRPGERRPRRPTGALIRGSHNDGVVCG